MNKNKRVHYLQHVDFEGLGYIRYWLEQNDFEITSTSLYEGPFQLPDPKQITALILMGGPMSIHDEQQYPWLKTEKDYIRNCVAAGVKILGICLGAQLLADVLGAGVHRADYKEIGWFPVRPETSLGRGHKASETAQSNSHPEKYLTQTILPVFQDQPTVFHWHGEQFDIPEGCMDLLDSEANNHQAFCLDNQIIGLQFHLEVTPESLALMIENGQQELKTSDPFIQSRELLLQGDKYITTCNHKMKQILEIWLDC